MYLLESDLLHLTYVLHRCLILIIGFNVKHGACVTQFTGWQKENIVSGMCADTSLESHQVSGLAACSLRCTIDTSCVAFTYDHSLIPSCYTMDVNPSSGCVDTSNAEHYTVLARYFYCPLDDEQYRTFILDDLSHFTIRVVHNKVDHPTALADCISTGGLLAKVSTVARLTMLQTLMTTCFGFGKTYYFLGGSNADATDYFASDAWVWPDGEVMNMNGTFWASGRPNYPGSDHCMVIEGGSYYWRFNDESCSLERNYICEIP